MDRIKLTSHVKKGDTLYTPYTEPDGLGKSLRITSVILFFYTSNLYPIPQMVLIYLPHFSPILLRSFCTWVSMVLASPK